MTAAMAITQYAITLAIMASKSHSKSNPVTESPCATPAHALDQYYDEIRRDAKHNRGYRRTYRPWQDVACKGAHGDRCGPPRRRKTPRHHHRSRFRAYAAPGRSADRLHRRSRA